MLWSRHIRRKFGRCRCIFGSWDAVRRTSRVEFFAPVSADATKVRFELEDALASNATGSRPFSGRGSFHSYTGRCHALRALGVWRRETWFKTAASATVVMRLTSGRIDGV